MTLFRPCIDLHQGKVKQIVGGSLRDEGPGPATNFETDADPADFARRYRDDALAGGHVIRLGPGNDAAARSALAAWPDGLQIGGGMREDNAQQWLDAGAQKLIVTSWLFEGPRLSMERVRAFASRVGRGRVVIDLSCRRHEDGWRVATDRWQTITDSAIGERLFSALAEHCSEFLVHAADVEGRCEGIDEELVALLGRVSPIPCTYAGGANDIGDLERVETLSGGRVDLTYGSALDLFGGRLVNYADCVDWNRAHGA